MKKYSEKEKNFIAHNYGKLSLTEIAKSLNRPTGSISTYIYDFINKKKKVVKHVTLKEIESGREFQKVVNLFEVCSDGSCDGCNIERPCTKLFDKIAEEWSESSSIIGTPYLKRVLEMGKSDMMPHEYEVFEEMLSLCY